MDVPARHIGRTIRDGEWEMLSWDPQTGRTVWAMEDGNGNTVVRTDYPVHSLLKQNEAARNDAPDGWKGDWHRVASVPLNLVHDQNTGLHEAFRQGDDKHISRFLNDPDNAKWRTRGGRV